MTTKLVPKFYVWDRWTMSRMSLRYGRREDAENYLLYLEFEKSKRPFMVKLADFLLKGFEDQFVVLTDYEIESDELAPDWE